MAAGEQDKLENQRGDQSEDFDLLTFGEARARLAEEIDAERARLENQRGTDAPAARITASERRLEDLRAALRRTTAGARITAANADEFFGRTTSGPASR
jgi:hypothetical protein